MTTPAKRKANEQALTESGSKRGRVDLTVEQKRAICYYKQANQKASQAEIAEHFTKAFKLDKTIGRTTICDIVKKVTKWEGAKSSNAKRLRLPEYEELEKVLYVWGNGLASQNVHVTDEMYIEHAKKIGEEIGISFSSFGYSKGSFFLILMMLIFLNYPSYSKLGH